MIKVLINGLILPEWLWSVVLSGHRLQSLNPGQTEFYHLFVQWKHSDIERLFL